MSGIREVELENTPMSMIDVDIDYKGEMITMYSKVTLANVTVLAAAWEGEAGVYSQVVTVDGVTPTTKVDLQPSVEQLDIFHDKDVAFTTENDNGVITVFAIGDKPTQDYVIQATLMEVNV